MGLEGRIGWSQDSTLDGIELSSYCLMDGSMEHGAWRYEVMAHRPSEEAQGMQAWQVHMAYRHEMHELRLVPKLGGKGSFP